LIFNFKFIKKILSYKILDLYHYCMAIFAAVYYRHPSNKMTVIGVTGTNGKTTVVHLISRILEKAGHKVGHISSIDFKINKDIRRNSLKMTMPGRFYLQKLLRDMARAGCDYVIMEVTSEGVKQFRHKGINFDIGVFTNLTPEHIERHGGFEKYKKAKLSFFRHLSGSKRKIIGGKKIEKVLVINGDDDYSEEFFNFPADKKYLYGFDKRYNTRLNISNLQAGNFDLSDIGSSFEINGENFKINLPGKFNVYNALAAICAAKSRGVAINVIKNALAEIKNVPGRMEHIEEGQPFKVVVDYAHTPDALHKVYETLRNKGSNLICVLGAAGGGRDKWKRPEMGKIAAQYCDKIILTDEDPYNESPLSILNDIENGFLQNKKCEKIADRGEAIKNALSSAKSGDIVVITGKGSENKMMVKNGWIPWDDRAVVRDELRNSIIRKHNIKH
jgi:UDP-N-acetylmuramoyl-L-alanyl-D-glutamate--2,6-diaminopimelate ligase